MTKQEYDIILDEIDRHGRAADEQETLLVLSQLRAFLVGFGAAVVTTKEFK